MQVSLVHLRSPVRLWHELGPAGFLSTQILIAGMIASALSHPLFIGLLVWSIAASGFLVPQPDPLTAALGGLSLSVLIAGYGFSMIAGWLAIRRRFRGIGRRQLVWSWPASRSTGS